MNLQTFLGLLGGGLGVFAIKLYVDWRKVKRTGQKDAVSPWQELVDRDAKRLNTLKNRITLLEENVDEKDGYIQKLEHVIIEAGLNLP
ncbi:MAG: hypothetical protein LBS74_11330 [Oscillospiraceae bacterium]|jgi:hypothetical protein|nr:hypothetical protein [Oscillospiraceae bacterium]